jgi:hypothetical protein
MKAKIVLCGVAICCVAVLVQGCSYLDSWQYLTQDETEEYSPEIPVDENESQINQEAEVSQVYYAYHKLDEKSQALYLEMLDALGNMREDVELSTLDHSLLDEVFTCVMNDHPELFFVTGYKYTEYTIGNKVTGISFSGTYSMERDEVYSDRLMISQIVTDCLAAAKSSDEYEIAKYLYECIINNTEYDKTVENNQNICSVFLQGRSVCQGYAKSMQYMLQEAGIQCFIVTGFTGGERHAWDLAKINNEYYYIDPTWGDASYSYNGNVEDSYAPSINYDYFMVTTDELTRTHSIEKVVDLPLCSSQSDNYFVREGLYFSDYDEARLYDIFNSDISKERGYVTIKCADGVYNIMISNLVESQKIFDLIDRQGESIAYTSNSELGTISFWNIY